MTIREKRAYDPPSGSDGRRYLVDRLWPRGMGRNDLRVDEWLRDLAPSPRLRAWYRHDPVKYAEFRRRYREELRSKQELLDRLVQEARAGTITLVFAARDAEHSNARVLVELLGEQLRGRLPK